MTTPEHSQTPKSIEPDDADLLEGTFSDTTVQNRLKALKAQDNKEIRKIIKAIPGLGEFLDIQE